MNTTQKNKLFVISKLREAYEDFKHHNELTQRIVPIIKKHFGNDVHVVLYKKHIICDSFDFEIWDGVSNLNYNDRVIMYFSLMVNSKPVTWQEAFLLELERINPLDSIEWQELQETLYSQLEKINSQIKELREKANNLISDLPIPPSATLRKARFFWERPTEETTKKFSEVWH